MFFPTRLLLSELLTMWRLKSQVLDTRIQKVSWVLLQLTFTNYSFQEDSSGRAVSMILLLS